MSAARWTLTRVKISTAKRTRAVDGWAHPDTPGLAVTASTSFYGCFAVTHVGSGCALGRTDLRTLGDGWSAALALATCGLDFTAPAEALGTPEAIRVMRDAWLPVLEAMGYLPTEPALRPAEEIARDWTKIAAEARSVQQGGAP